MNVFPPLPGAEQRPRSLPRPPLRVLSLLGAAVLLLWLKSASERGHATSPALVVLLALIGSYGAVTVVGGHRLRAIAAWRGWPSLAAVRSWTWTPLAAVLTLQSVAALSLRNTAFQDEANYLYVGHEYIRMWQGGPAPVEPFDKYVSGVAYFYPVLAGALDLVGGLALVRLFSLACMATATACVYLIAKRLFGDDAGLLGAVAFAIQGPVLFLSHLATYDALCLALLAVAGMLAIKCGDSQSQLWAPLVGAVLMLAVAAKYVGVLFFPTVLAMLWLHTCRQQGWRVAFLRSGLCLAVIGAVWLAVKDTSLWSNFLFNTLNRAAGHIDQPRLMMAGQWLEWAGLFTALAAAGFALVPARGRLLGLVLLGGAFIAPAYHIYAAEPVSFPKHIAYGLVFAGPLVGLALMRLGNFGIRPNIAMRWPLVMALALIMFTVGVRQAQFMFAAWPNSSGLIQLLRTQVRPNVGRILVEEDEVPRYYLQDIVSDWQWNHLYWFDYQSKTGETLSGADAYKAAIGDGYWDWVVLLYGYNAGLARQIDPALGPDSDYELLAKVPYHSAYGNGYYWVWRKKQPPPAASLR